jgi:antitoxin HicB
MHLKLPLIFEPQTEGGFTVTSPLLPELITEGDSVEDALENVRDALAAVIKSTRRRGGLCRRVCRRKTSSQAGKPDLVGQALDLDLFGPALHLGRVDGPGVPDEGVGDGAGQGMTEERLGVEALEPAVDQSAKE